jgi:hypothetical protein
MTHQNQKQILQQRRKITNRVDEEKQISQETNTSITEENHESR